MSGWETYKGLEVPQTPTGDAGIKLKDDLKELADRSLATSAVLGSVMFVGADVNGDKILAEDNNNFFWDDANNRLGIGTKTPSDLVQIQGQNKGLLMSTGSTVGGVNDTMITFGAGTSASVQWTRLRYRYGNSDLYFERRSAADVWTNVMTLDWTKSRVGIGTEDPDTLLDVRGPISLGLPPELPLANPDASQIVLYTKDDAGVLELRVRFPNGTDKLVANQT